MKKVTIRTVAQDAGVSVSAVSKVLRDAYGVSDGLRQQVMRSVEKLGYRPRMAARGMRGGRTYVLGVVVSQLRNPFIPDLIDGIRSAADAGNYRMMIGVGEASGMVEAELVDLMIDASMDGVILIAPSMEPAAVERYAARIPLVCLAYNPPEPSEYSVVNGDDSLGARIAVEHLVDVGCRSIGMLTLKPYPHFDTDVVRPREQGFEAAMRDAGLEGGTRLIRLNALRARSEGELAALFRAPLPEGLFCWSDLDAIRLLDHAARAGIRVPEDLAVVGYDNSHPAALPQIDLTSVDQDGHSLGQQAGEVLLARITGAPAPGGSRLSLAPRLVRRGSSARKT